MTYLQIIMVIYTLANIKESDMLTLSNKQITVTFHDYGKSWNEAEAICEADGGILYVEDSPERRKVMETYINKNDLWIGLHNPSNGTDGLFAWTNCFWLSSDYNRYKSQELNHNNDKRCILYHENKWKAHQCTEKKKFVCEVSGDECTFYTRTGTPVPKPDYTTVNMTAVNESTCKSNCLENIYNNTNCWGLVFMPQERSDNCALYYTTNPFYFNDTVTVDNSNITMFIKNCYTSNTTGNPKVEGDNIPDESNNDKMPVNVCVSYQNKTTPTTTTANAPTTTTTPVITTTTTTINVPSTTTTTTNNPPSTSNPPITTTTTIEKPTTTTATDAPITTSTHAPISTTTTDRPTTTTPACNCKCSDLSKLLQNYTVDPEWKNMTTEEKVEQLVTKLRVDKKQLSSFVRRKTSAPDNRVASKSVGYLAISLISVLFGLIIVSDALNFIKYLTKRRERKRVSDLRDKHFSL